MNHKQRALAAGVAAACTWLGTAHSADNHTITVSAAVQGKCTFNAATSSMSAITVDPTAAGNVTGSHTVLFRCTKGTTSTMTFAAQNTGGTGTTGNLVNGTETLGYSYGTTGGAQAGTGLGASQDKTLTVGVTISQPAAADLSAGTYTDTILVSVTP